MFLSCRLDYSRFLGAKLHKLFEITKCFTIFFQKSAPLPQAAHLKITYQGIKIMKKEYHSIFENTHLLVPLDLVNVMV